VHGHKYIAKTIRFEWPRSVYVYVSDVEVQKGNLRVWMGVIDFLCMCDIRGVIKEMKERQML
jgi:hypothetical protein